MILDLHRQGAGVSAIARRTGLDRKRRTGGAALRRAGTVVQPTVTPVDIEPNRMFLEGMEASARVMQANGRRIGYVHVWSYAGYAYQRALERGRHAEVRRRADLGPS